MDTLKFTTIDDKAHVIGPGEYTVCGEAIPFGNGYTNDQPKKLCADCKAKTKDTEEFGVLRADNEPEPEPLVPEEAPVEDGPAPKATKDTAPSATAKATKSGDKT